MQITCPLINHSPPSFLSLSLAIPYLVSIEDVFPKRSCGIPVNTLEGEGVEEGD